jgi:hypothetical protein
MRSWTDRLVLCGLVALGGGLISVGAGKAIARYTISGSPVLIAAADSDAPPPRVARDDGLAQLADDLAPPPHFPPDPG